MVHNGIMVENPQCLLFQTTGDVIPTQGKKNGVQQLWYLALNEDSKGHSANVIFLLQTLELGLQ